VHDLDRFYHPRTVAIIGASDTAGRPNYLLLNKVRAKLEPEGTTVYPVNPRVESIDGLRCYASVHDIDDEIDLAVIMVGDAIAAMEEVAKKGARFAIVFTAGFSEVGAEGAERERRLGEIAAAGGVRLMGPNTNVNAFEDFAERDGKKVCLITQSGHQGRPIVQGERLGIGFRHWAPTGNEVDLDVADFVDYFASLDDCGAIAMYVEGFRDGPKLVRALAHAAAKVPIVCVKVGRSEAGERMALAHTGHLTGADRVVDAVFDRYGVIRVDDLDEVMEIAGLFTLAPPPRGDRVAIYAISGGSGAHLADLFGAAGIPMPDIAPATQEVCRKFIPEYLKVSNPVDNGANAIRAGDANVTILRALVDDPATDIVVIPITGILESISVKYCTDIAAVAAESAKPVIVLWGSPITDEGFDILCEARVPIVRSFRNGTRAVKAFTDWYRFAGTYQPPPTCDGVTAVTGAIETGVLGDDAARAVLEEAGVPLVRQQLCADAAAAAAAAGSIGCPVVLKVASVDIPHKSDLGLVAVGVADAESVAATATALLARAAEAAPDAHVDGIVVQEMVSGGVELLVGVSRDPLFGPVLAVGTGGVFAEVLDDVALSLAPVDAARAAEMLERLRGSALLDGARGTDPVDRDAVIDAICAVGRLACDPRIAELDVNPLIASADGCRAVDALIVGREAG